MPFTGNHWLLTALAGLAILVTRADPVFYLPALRWIFVVFYGFAALAKLNSGFFDPSVSCAVFYANQWLDGFGFGGVPIGSPAGGLIVWLTVAVELSVVPLLLIRRTRYFGVLLATAFHSLISFDLNQHFYDFTAILVALLVCFLPEDAVSEVSRPLPGGTSPFLRLTWLTLGAFLILIAVLPATVLTVAILDLLPFAIWIPISLLWLLRVLRRPHSHPVLSWKPGWLAGGVVLLAFVNGLTPYLEIKTAYGFNMYANLVTAQGNTNHFLIGKTIPLRNGYERPVEIVRSSDPGLRLYREHGYLIAYPQFQRYLVGKELTAELVRGGERFSLSEASTLADSGPWWWRYFGLRSLDESTPPRCQDVFLPAL
jgi:hypothetical protein